LEAPGRGTTRRIRRETSRRRRTPQAVARVGGHPGGCRLEELKACSSDRTRTMGTRTRDAAIWSARGQKPAQRHDLACRAYGFGCGGPQPLDGRTAMRAHAGHRRKHQHRQPRRIGRGAAATGFVYPVDWMAEARPEQSARGRRAARDAAANARGTEGSRRCPRKQPQSAE